MFPYLLPCFAVTLMPGAIGCGLAWRGAPEADARRAWKLMARGLAVSVLVTVVYHVPTNLRIWSGTLTEAELAVQLQWWLVMHFVRWAAALLGVFAGARQLVAALEGR